MPCFKHSFPPVPARPARHPQKPCRTHSPAVVNFPKPLFFPQGRRRALPSKFVPTKQLLFLVSFPSSPPSAPSMSRPQTENGESPGLHHRPCPRRPEHLQTQQHGLCSPGQHKGNLQHSGASCGSNVTERIVRNSFLLSNCMFSSGAANPESLRTPPFPLSSLKQIDSNDNKR